MLSYKLTFRPVQECQPLLQLSEPSTWVSVITPCVFEAARNKSVGNTGEKYLFFSLFHSLCVYLGKRGGEKRRATSELYVVETIRFAGLVSVVQPCFSLPANLVDCLFLRVKVDFSHSFSSVFCGNYVNYTSHHCVFSTSFDLTFRTNKRIIIFMGNLCFMV